VSTCRHAPQGGTASSTAAQNTATARMSRTPRPTAVHTAERSAQIVSPYERFSTFVPVTTVPSAHASAAPTGKREYGDHEAVAAAAAASSSASSAERSVDNPTSPWLRWTTVDVKKRRPLRGALAALPLIVAHFFLFPYPLGREVVLRARWRVPLPVDGSAAAGTARAGAGPEATAAPFQLGDLYGFVTPDGRLASLDRTPFRVALSRRGSVAYGRIGGTWMLDGPSAQPLISFSGNGYPLLSPDGERILLVQTDLTGLRELGEAGDTSWDRDFPSLLTSVAIAGDWLAAGLLNGAVSIVDRTGALVFEEAPTGSRISAAFGVAITADGRRLAAVTGIGPQQLTLWRRSRDGFAAASRVPLESDFRREVRIAFSGDGSSLASEAAAGVVIVDAENGNHSLVPLRGRLTGMAFLGTGGGRAGTWLVAARDGAGAELAAVRPPDAVLARVPLGRQAWGPDSPWLGTAGDTLLVAFAGSLVGLGLEAR
jgi:hypothetical protein